MEAQNDGEDSTRWDTAGDRGHATVGDAGRRGHEDDSSNNGEGDAADERGSDSGYSRAQFIRMNERMNENKRTKENER